METDSQISSAEVIPALVRRHTHDLRNSLNGIELELTLLTEATEKAEQTASIEKMRQELRAAEAMIRLFAAKFAVEDKTTVCVSDVAEQWMSDARGLLPDRPVVWDIQAGNGVIQVERARFRGVLGDLLLLTARRWPAILEAACRTESGTARFSVSWIRPDSGSDRVDRIDPVEDLLWQPVQEFAQRNGGRLERTKGTVHRSAVHLVIPSP